MVSTSTVVGTDAARVAAEAELLGEETARSAVSWSAIILGAIAATATALILLTLGTGLGLTMVSPWAHEGSSAMTVGVAAVIWFFVVHWLSSALGGYLTGRLRNKWVRIRSHEIFFRDTAHGFLAWALWVVAGAFLFSWLAAAGIGGAARGASEAAANAVPAVAQNLAQNGDNEGYFVDMLLRSTTPTGEAGGNDSRAQIGRILSRSIQDGKVTLAPDDRTYLAQMVAARTGASQADAEARVDSIVSQLNDAQQKARATADEARKRAAQFSIAIAIAMVIGAFIAGLTAALGGRTRDEPDSSLRRAR
jgi:hypothetical protein